MKIVDANVMLVAINQDSEQHAVARAWLDSALGGYETVGFAWPAMLAFLRISTHRAVFERPLATSEAIATMSAWLDQPATTVVEPSARHLGVMGGLLESAGTAGNLVNDAHLAALAIENSATLVSFDSDFARFSGLRWQAPGA